MCGNMSRKTIAEKMDLRIGSRLKRDGSVLIELTGTIPDYSEYHP